MITKDAVTKVLESRTKYRLSQDMGCAPILVSYWLKGTKMGTQYRTIFELKYWIVINDSLGTSNDNS